MNDAKRHSPACERNRDPILGVLKDVFSSATSVLEIASGTGMHAVHFSAGLPHLTWQPSDQEEAALASVEAWRAAEPRENLRAPIRLDVTEHPWPLGSLTVDAIFNANMIHISPFECTRALLGGASEVLPEGGLLALYGPYRIGGVHTAPSNEAFDQSLRARDPSWGIRDLEEVQRLAEEVGLAYERRIEMPANNQTVVFRR